MSVLQGPLPGKRVEEKEEMLLVAVETSIISMMLLKNTEGQSFKYIQTDIWTSTVAVVCQ